MRGDPNSIACAVRGPITLITVGALFALQNFTPYSFGQTWPVLLIVFGLLSLLCRGTRQSAPPPAAPPTAPPYSSYTPPPAAGSYRQSPYTQPAGAPKATNPADAAGTEQPPQGGSV